MELKNRNILICGGGIAGLTIAYWLKKFGFRPTIVEKAPAIREGGYMIDFWGVGFTVAEKMFITEQLHQEYYPIPEVTFVNKKGKRVGGLKLEQLRKQLKNRYFSLLRSSLEKVLYRQVKDEVEIIFSNSIAAIEEKPQETIITFTDNSQRNFDLLIGADGLHSVVRKLYFGEEDAFKSFMGYYAASFTIDNYLPDPHVFKSHTVNGKQVGIYGISENSLATFFIFKSELIKFGAQPVTSVKALLKENFKEVEWECPSLLQKMDTSADFYFDEVSQVKMSNWYKGRVALLGDACQCVSLIAGQGSSLAMAAAYILAGELKKANGDHTEAFAAYQRKMKPEILRKQRMAKDFAGSFVPETTIGIWSRNFFSRLMTLPVFSDIFINWFLADKLDLEDY